MNTRLLFLAIFLSGCGNVSGSESVNAVPGKLTPNLIRNSTICCLQRPQNGHSVTLFARENIGKSPGFDQGSYSTIGVIIGTPRSKSPFQPFIDLRAHVSNSGQYAANGGFGARYRSDCREMFVGINAYYDYRKARNDFRQIGVGGEIGIKDTILRGNGYIPIGKKRYEHELERLYFPNGSYLYYAHLREGYSGFEGEIETSLRRRLRIYPSRWNVTFAGGGYYFVKKYQENIKGGKVRLTLSYQNILTFEVKSTYDNVYHGRTQGVFSLVLPLAPPSSCNYCCLPRRPESVLPVVRDEMIHVKKYGARGCGLPEERL